MELLTALRLDVDQEISTRLQHLYSYMMRRLVEANAAQTAEPLEEVLRLLVTLSEAWSGVVSRTAGNETGPAVHDPQPGRVGRWQQETAAPDNARYAMTA